MVREGGTAEHLGDAAASTTIWPSLKDAGIRDPEHLLIKEVDMKAQLTQRLADLRTRFESGQKLMTDIEIQQANLRTTLLRLSGAIQVLEEELGRADALSADSETSTHDLSGSASASRRPSQPQSAAASTSDDELHRLSASSGR